MRPPQSPQAGQRRPRKHLQAVELQLVVLTDGTLIDGTGAPPLPDEAVVVRQWSNEPAPYPVLRVGVRPPVPTLLVPAD